MKTDTVAPQDQADHELGLEIIRVLGLKRKRANGRVETTHGDKNPCGLARTLRHLSATKQVTELLDALKEARTVLKWAAQESKGKVKAEVVGGWIHHADKIENVINSIA